MPGSGQALFRSKNSSTNLFLFQFCFTNSLVDNSESLSLLPQDWPIW